MSHSFWHFHGEKAEWTFETGWQDPETGEAMPAYEPFVLAGARSITDPDSQRALMQLLFAFGYHLGMELFLRWLTFGRQGYRSLSGIAFEAVVGVKPLHAAKKVVGPAVFGAGLVSLIDVGIRGHRSFFATHILDPIFDIVDPWGVSQFEMR